MTNAVFLRISYIVIGMVIKQAPWMSINWGSYFKPSGNIVVVSSSKFVWNNLKTFYEEKQFFVTSNFETPRAYFHEANVKTNIVAKCKFLISRFLDIFNIVKLE